MTTLEEKFKDEINAYIKPVVHGANRVGYDIDLREAAQSCAQLCAEEKKHEAIEFAEWICENTQDSYYADEILIFTLTGERKHQTVTAAELYAIFEQQKQKE